MDDPEGNLVIVERVVHENQRCFPDWEHGWGGTAHVLTSTQDGAVEQKEQKEVKYIVPKEKPELAVCVCCIIFARFLLSFGVRFLVELTPLNSNPNIRRNP